MPHVFLALVQRVLRFPLRRPGLVTASILTGAVVAGATAATPAPSSTLAGSAVDVIPADAAFVSATLRGREQLERITKSNAFKSLKSLPGIARALDSLEEQRTMPGSPIAMIDTFMEFPENEQALDLIRDMVATDTFVYGDPSCIVFLELLQKLQRVQQFTGIATAPLQEDGGLLPLFEQDDEDEEEDAEENDVGAAGRRVRARTVARRATDAAEAIPAESVRQRALVKVLAENLDLIVVPDVVWGFRTTKPDAAKSQLKRIEVLAKLVIQANPDLADSMSRRKVAGGEVVTFTLDGQRLPWDSIRRELAGDIGDVDGLDRVIDRLQDLDIVVALGLIGDRVILSIGDSIEHLGKLAVPGSGNKSLLTSPALAPLVANADRPITGISYVSRELAAANAGSSRDVEPIADVVGDFFAANDLPAEAADETEKWLEDAARKLSARMPVPDAWLSFSFMTDDGYEGYAWDWAKNQPTDASARLGLLRHAGGDPLAVLVSRIRSDDAVLDDVAAFLRTGWSIVRRHLVPRAGDEAQEMAGKFAEQFVPLGERFMAILREKIVPSLADGQVGLVLDAKSRSERPQASLPAASEPLPLPEPAIVLPLADAKLFRTGMSDLFTLGDDLVATIRNVDPDAVPAGYEIPDPEKEKTESGTLWSFRLPHSGLDDQVRPTIGVGDRAAAFTFLPSQAGRMLAAANLQTAADVSAFDAPLSGAAAVDFSRLVAAIRPWVVYVARYAGVHAASGGVDADMKLTADVETPEAREAIAHAGVILEALSCLRTAAAETSVKDGALVTHWRARARDLPSK